MSDEEAWIDPKTPNTHSFCLTLPNHILATIERVRFASVKDRKKPRPRSDLIEEAVLTWLELNGHALEPFGTLAPITRKPKKGAAPPKESAPTDTPATPKGSEELQLAVAATSDARERQKFVRDYIKKAQRGEK